MARIKGREVKLEASLAELEAIAPVRRDEPMARHTSFGIGGPADLFAMARTEGQLVGLLDAARRLGLPVFLLGHGSNILVGDRGVRSLVIWNDARAVEGPFPNGDGVLVRAQSGVSVAALARRLARRGLAGLEWAVGVPGSLGGAVVQNAGAYGGCLADVLGRVWIWDGKEEKVVKAEDVGLSYRRSAFTDGRLAGAVVLAAELRLRPADSRELLRQISDLDRRRRREQPRGPSAGSIFKNPPQHPAWWLIDQVGLRGYRIGDAQISPQHANFIVNLGGAMAWQVKALMDLARRRVQEEFAIELEPEIRLVGEGFQGKAIPLRGSPGPGGSGTNGEG